MNRGRLTNFANKWRSSDKWTLPTEGRTVSLQNSSKNTVLRVRGSEVIEEAINQNDRSQTWYKREVGTDGYFTLTNPATDRDLTATNDGTLEAIGKLLRKGLCILCCQ